MGLLSCVLKLTISIVNFLLLAVGIVLLVIGALLIWGVNFVIKQIYDIQTQIQPALQSLNVHTDARGVILLIQQNSSSLGVIGFSIGLILVAVAVLGIITVSCCSVKNLWILICIFLIIITFGLIILLLFFGFNKTEQVLEPFLKNLQKIINEYQDINSTQSESLFVNFVQITANCCGLYNYTDFNTATNFNRLAFDSQNSKHNLSFPLSCCNYQQDFTITQKDRDSCIKTSESFKKNKGCWKEFEKDFKKYLDYCFMYLGLTIGILVATIIATVILIILIDRITDNVLFTAIS